MIFIENMVELNNDNLEKALDSKQPTQQVSPQEEMGYHKGALNTLVAERNELYKMIQNVELIMQVHIKRLEEMGVKIQTEQKPSEQPSQ